MADQQRIIDSDLKCCELAIKTSGESLIESGLDGMSFLDQLEGRRIVDMQCVFRQVWKLSDHDSILDCRLKNVRFESEVQFGLSYLWKFKKFEIYSEEEIARKIKNETPDHMPCTTAAIAGIVSSGNGQAVLDQVLSKMEVPTLSSKTYKKHGEEIDRKFIKEAESNMLNAGQEQTRLARENGDVGDDGIPNIAVTADGAWSRRSLRKNYAALCGAATIVGMRTGQILCIGLKNKYCLKCVLLSGDDGSSDNHVCFRNYAGSSASMEQ